MTDKINNLETTLLQAIEALKNVQSKTQLNYNSLESSKHNNGNQVSDSIVKYMQQQNSMIHTKLDMIVRQLDTLNENQKKLSKELKDHLKSSKRSNCDLANDEILSTQNPKRIKLNDINNTNSNLEIDEHHQWAKDMLLVGDYFWSRLKETSSLKSKIKTLEKTANFRIISRKWDNIHSLFDCDRSKILFAMPINVSKVAISIGTMDILQDTSLLTLKDANLGEVKKRNEPILKQKVSSLIKLIQHLISDGKKVFYLMPLKMEKIEIFNHWEKIIQDEASSLPSEMFHLLNLPEIMRESRDKLQDYISSWFTSDPSNPKEKILTFYGNEQIFHLLEKSVKSRSQKECLRCLANHPGFEVECKGKEKACRTCGQVGHLSKIHSVTNVELKEKLKRFHGEDIFDQFSGVEGPLNRGIYPYFKAITSSNSTIVHGKNVNLDDYYTKR